MNNSSCYFQRPKQHPRGAAFRRPAVGAAVAALLLCMSAAVAQQSTSGSETLTPGTQVTIPDGYTAHHSVDLGGRMSDITGSAAMYDTLVNLHSGPRVQGESFQMHALPGKKHTLVDSLSAFGTGFGGDPYIFSKLDASKGKVYEFSGMFRRDRQYFDYDLLANPNIVPGTIPIGPSNAPTGQMQWGPVEQSPMMFNTVRRMTDTNLTILPLSKFTYRAGYSQNVFEGPSLSPAYSVGKYDSLTEEYQRNSTDDFMGAIDWKPVSGTKLTFEEQVTHYKGDSYFTLNPNGYQAQEADGQRVNLGNWDSQTPYGISACNTSSMGSAYTDSTTYQIFSNPQTPGGLPVINPACAVVTSYLRSQPTRITTPTEIFRMQSSSIRNITMNGDARYTLANMSLPNYYENIQGLDGAVRSIIYNGYARAHREVFSADYGIVWQVTPTVTLSDQVDYSSSHQPGYSNVPIADTLSTPGPPDQTITYSGPLTPGNAVSLPHGMNGVLTNNYFGYQYLFNNLTASWDVTPRARFSLTYRYGNRNIGQGVPHDVPIPDELGDPVNGKVSITENGGIFNAAVRLRNNLDVNGSVEALYDDNVLTPVSPRQTQHYRIHTTYKPKPWATVTGAYNDLERHNNTNNNQAPVAAGLIPYNGPIAHVDHARTGSVAAVLAPNEHYGLDFNYTFSSVFAATNICFTNGAATGFPGAATLTSSGAPNLCVGGKQWFGRDFMDAPTHSGSVALHLSPVDKVHATLGYNINSVDGSRFFNDARDVNGSLVSTYQSPYADLAYTMRPGLTWKAEYNFYGYGEGGPSGAQYCSTSTSAAASVVPCASLPYPTGRTEPPSGLTAPRNFHANNVTLGVHYEF